MTENILPISSLQKHFPARTGKDIPVLRKLSLTLRPGDFVALRGPSGCGKTTLLLCAGALSRPTAGSVLIDNCDPYALSPTARSAFRATHVGFVFQNFHLIPYLSVLDNIILCGLTAAPKPALTTRALGMLDKLGLSHRLRHRPAELSTGEQQRVALVRALAGGAKLILADEPTGNLDPANSRILLDTLADIANQGGAVLMVTHEPAACDRALTRLDMLDGCLHSC